jgi:hypothetical protein
MTTIIAVNQTVGALALNQLPVPDNEIPAGVGNTVTLTDYATVSEIQDDVDLIAHITAGDCILNDGASDLTHAQSLAVTSTVTATLEGTAVMESLVDAKGDLVAATADDEVERLPVGADRQVLAANSVQPSGLSWVDLPEAAFANYYHSVSYAGITTTASTLPFNTARITNAAFTLSGSSELTINTDGSYRVDFGCSSSEASNNDAVADIWVELNTGGGFAEVGGTRARWFHDSSDEEGGNAGFAILELDATDVIRIRGQIVDGTDQVDTLADSLRLSIQTVGANGAAGATGPQGPAGSGSSVIVEDEGSVVAGGPHTNLDFVGDAVTVTDAGGGVANISIDGFTPNVSQYRQSGNLTINTTATTVVLNANDFQDSGYTRSGENVTINTAGVYRISYSIMFDTNANARRTVDGWVENNTVEIVPSRSSSYSRNTIDDTANSSAAFLVQLAASDVVRLRCQSTGTSGTAIGQGNRMWLTIEFVRS